MPPSLSARTPMLYVKWSLASITLFVLLLAGRGAAQNCTPEVTQTQALMQLYQASGGDRWLKRTGWGNDNITCTVPLHTHDNKVVKTVPLPAHCCWYGVSCCLQAEMNSSFVECSQYQCNCTVRYVTGISLGRNNLAGLFDRIINGSVIDGLSCSLKMIFMGGNDIGGIVPEHIRKLQSLEILSIGSNWINGTIPDAFTVMRELRELDLGNNDLTGEVPAGLCGGRARISQLHDLILSNNYFTGPLSVTDCENLIYLDAQNNALSGPIPNLTGYHQLHILRLGNNSFTGPVSVSSFDLRLLVVVDLSNNQLTGPLPNFVDNGGGQLTLVRLYNNRFTGSIPQNLFDLGTLASLALDNNLLTGTLPEEIGEARGLSALMIASNSIRGSLPAALIWMAMAQGVLDASRTNMSCCGIPDPNMTGGYTEFNYSAPRLPPFLVQDSNLARSVTDNDGGSYVGMRCPLIALSPDYSNTTDTVILNWALDPEYYFYQGCYCLHGFIEAWYQPEAGVPSMGPRMACLQEQRPWWQRAPWAIVLIVLGGLLVASWLTYLMCFRKGKNAAIVQGCLNIRKRIQGEPIGGQVSIVVTDIEGYSDLMKQSPELMTRALNLHNAIVRKSRWSNFGYTVEQEGDSYALVFYQAHDAVIFCLQTQLALNRQQWPEGLFTLDIKDAASRRRTPAPGLLNAISVMTNNLTASLFGGRISMQGQVGSEERASSLQPLPSNLRAHVCPDGTMRPDSRQSSIAHPIACEYSALGTPSAMGGHGGFNKNHPVLFNGMRVRMGIATGNLPVGSNSKGSAVMDFAKVVSDTANGGQIMMDERTFKAVKERIEEFGAVDHNGMNYKKLNSIQPPWYSCAKRKHLRNPDDALLLDMGEYVYCPGCKRLPLFQLEATPAGETPGGTSSGLPASPKGTGRRSKGSEPMRLYQLVPPALLSRAKVFGNKVTVKDEWFCSDAPYFAAPGTLDAPLGPIEGPVLLPPITMAFLIAENGKPFSARNRRDARRVNDVAVACIRACLRCVPGGYLCRMQDGDLKYMVAFSTPQAAVEWSLLLQDVLMYAEWPESALKFWREEFDDRGRLVFRGPRMKIGLCEGNPRSIIPDHIGRADYHGASINQAARYMDAAAHGGMVALEAALAIKVMEYWRTTTALGYPPEAPVSTSTLGAGPSATGPSSLSAFLGPSASEAAMPSADWSCRSVAGSEDNSTAAGTGSGAGAGAAHRGIRMEAVREEEGGAQAQAQAQQAQLAVASSFATARHDGNKEEEQEAAAMAVATAAGAAAAAAAAAAAQAAAEGEELRSGKKKRESGGKAVAAAGRAGGSEPWLGSGWSFKKIFQSANSTGSAPAGGGGGKGSSVKVQNALAATGARSDQDIEVGVPAIATGAAAAATAAAATSGSGGTELAEVGELPTFRDLVPDVAGPDQQAGVAEAPPAAPEGPSEGQAVAGAISDPAPASAPATTSSSSAYASPSGSSGPGPVAEGSEQDSPATAVVANGGGGKVPNGGDAAAAGGSSAAVVLSAAAAAGHFDVLSAESGPSMTSLAESDNLAAGAGSTTSTPPTSGAAITSGGDGVRAAAATAAAAVVAAASPPLARREAARRRPSPLGAVASPQLVSQDGAASGTAANAAAAAAGAGAAGAGAGAEEEITVGVPKPSAGSVSATGMAGPGSNTLASSNPATRSSAPQLAAIEQGSSGAGTAAAAGGAAAVSNISMGSGSAGTLGGKSVFPPPRHPSALRNSGPGQMRSHVSFAATPSTAAAVTAAAAATATGGGASRPHPQPLTLPFARTSTEGAAPSPGLPQRCFSTATAPSGATASASATGPSPLMRKVLSSSPGLLAAATGSGTSSGGGGQISPATSTIIRSPRPPSLTPLALPSERERDEALRADRAAAEAARQVMVDGPADARCPVRVEAYRIGIFRFKGNPEAIQMAHITLEHLQGRRFPSDAPKGKGNKVGESFGLVDECKTTLPDLASIMRDRYMLSRPAALHPNAHAALMDDARSSPSGRRLRMLLSGVSAFGPGPSASPGSNSPGRSFLGKSRSLGPRSAAAGGAGVESGGSGGGGGDTGSPLAAGSQSVRRGSNLVVQMVNQITTASTRWTSSVPARLAIDTDDGAAAPSASPPAAEASNEYGSLASLAVGSSAFGSIAGVVSVALDGEPPSIPPIRETNASGGGDRASGGGTGRIEQVVEAEGSGKAAPPVPEAAASAATEVTASATVDPRVGEARGDEQV